MGYRNYIGSLPKEEYNKFKDFNQEELYKYKGQDPDDEDAYVWMGDLIPNCHYELGKYVESFPNEFFKPVFTNKEMQDYYTQENDFYVVEKAFLEHVIESYSQKVRKIYKDMLTPFFPERQPSEFLNTIKSSYKSDESFDKAHTFDFSKITDEEQTSLFKMVEHVKSMGQEWGINSFMDDMRPYNLESNDVVSDSWKYEYAQFELVRIYKTFDWGKNVMVYYGY